MSERDTILATRDITSQGWLAVALSVVSTGAVDSMHVVSIEPVSAVWYTGGGDGVASPTP